MPHQLWKHPWRGAILYAAAVLAAAQPLYSQQATADTVRITLAQARSIALERNPAYRADALDTAVARGNLSQARTYQFNPEVEFEAPGAFDGLGGYEAEVSQEIEWAGQWGLRKEAAAFGLRAAGFRVSDAQRSLLVVVSLAYFEAWAHSERLRVAEDALVLNTRLVEAARVQLREGEISALEANLAEVEAGRARARVFGARRDASAASIALGRHIGLSPETAVMPTAPVETLPDPTTLELPDLLTMAVRRRPDLAEAGARAREADTRARLASREALPNLKIGALFGRESTTDPTRWGLSVELPLPLWNRNGGRTDAERAVALQADFRQSSVELRVRAEVTRAVDAYRAASGEALVYQQEVLEPARESQGMLDSAYREGKIDLASLVLLRNQLLDAELGYWTAWLARRKAFIHLRAATGELSAAGKLDE